MCQTCHRRSRFQNTIEIPHAALFAREADALTGRRARDQALELLRQAFAQGYGRDRAEADRDLDGVRQDRRFLSALRIRRRD